MQQRKPNYLVWLVVGLPALSVLMGIVTIYLAVTFNDPGVRVNEQPLSKTSWKQKP